MKQYASRIMRLVGVVLVKQVIAGMMRVDQCGQFLAQHFNLSVIEQTNSGEIAVLVKKSDLLGG